MVSFVQYCLVLLLTIASSYCGPAGLARRSPSEGNPSADDVSHQFKYWSPKKTPYERRPYWFIGNRQDWVVAQNQARIQAALMNTPYSARVKYRDWMACMNRRARLLQPRLRTHAPVWSLLTEKVAEDELLRLAKLSEMCVTVVRAAHKAGQAKIAELELRRVDDDLAEEDIPEHSNHPYYEQIRRDIQRREEQEFSKTDFSMAVHDLSKALFQLPPFRGNRPSAGSAGLVGKGTGWRLPPR